MSKRDWWMLTDIKSSRAPITTTPVGEKIQEKLWDDMLKEFLKLDASLRIPKGQTV